MPRTRLAVLGSPIAHSKSPAIHRAAYGVLGLDWSYESADVTGHALEQYIDSRDASWRGLSLTMPLKRDILPLLASRDALVDIVGAANTVLFTDTGLRGYNTDVYGIVSALGDAGVHELDSVQVLGSGATAASVLVAVAQLGARTVTISARTPENAAALLEVAGRLDVSLTVQPWGAEVERTPDLVVSTIPGGAGAGNEFSLAVRAGAVLFDVAYDPWPSALAASWLAAGGTVVSGLDMLIHQAIGQVRVFASGDPSQALPREAEVLAAMRAAVV